MRPNEALSAWRQEDENSAICRTISFGYLLPESGRVVPHRHFIMNPYQKMTRNELVKWINSTLLMNIQSIEKIYNGMVSARKLIFRSHLLSAHAHALSW